MTNVMTDVWRERYDRWYTDALERTYRHNQAWYVSKFQPFYILFAEGRSQVEVTHLLGYTRPYAHMQQRMMFALFPSICWPTDWLTQMYRNQPEEVVQRVRHQVWVAEQDRLRRRYAAVIARHQDRPYSNESSGGHYYILRLLQSYKLIPNAREMHRLVIARALIDAATHGCTSPLDVCRRHGISRIDMCEVFVLYPALGELYDAHAIATLRPSR